MNQILLNKIDDNIKYQVQSITQNLMFLFSCCRSAESNHGYRVLKNSRNINDDNFTFVNSLQQVNKKDLNNQQIHVLKLEKSQYQSIMKSLQSSKGEKKWNDCDFPPNSSSIGNISSNQNNIANCQWKRISDLLNKPALFDGKVSPKDVVQTNIGSCYFLSALAALAQNEFNIKKIFQNQKYNPHGIYKATLRIDGQIKQILVDDFVPVNVRGEPLFCQPNKNQFWVLIIQKVWAKIHNNYANIASGSPAQVFKALTYAPAQTYSIKQNQQQHQKIWKKLVYHTSKNHPICCETEQRQHIDWDKIGIKPNHNYTLITAVQMMSEDGKRHRMMMLRNPQGKIQWEGQGAENDQQFWNSIKPSEEKSKFINKKNQSFQGIFYMNFNEFCKYFSQIYVSMAQFNSNYISEEFIPNKDKANIYSFNVQKSGLYYFELHQPSLNFQGIPQPNQQGLNRSTLLLAKILPKKQTQTVSNKQTKDDYLFIDGILKYNDQDTTIRAQLQPGRYILYCKLDPSRISNKMPEKAIVSVYSTSLINLNLVSQDLQSSILHRMFLNHGKQNKRQTYNNQLMWLSWRLLFQQGGYAYICFGNSIESNKKFVVKLNSKQFDDMNFQLLQVRDSSGNSQHQYQIKPGEQAVFLSRVKNLVFKGLKFPPQLGIKLQKVDVVFKDKSLPE